MVVWDWNRLPTLVDDRRTEPDTSHRHARALKELELAILSRRRLDERVGLGGGEYDPHISRICGQMEFLVDQQTPERVTYAPKVFVSNIWFGPKILDVAKVLVDAEVQLGAVRCFLGLCHVPVLHKGSFAYGT